MYFHFFNQGSVSFLNIKHKTVYQTFNIFHFYHCISAPLFYRLEYLRTNHLSYNVVVVFAGPGWKNVRSSRVFDPDWKLITIFTGFFEYALHFCNNVCLLETYFRIFLPNDIYTVANTSLHWRNGLFLHSGYYPKLLVFHVLEPTNSVMMGLICENAL